MDQCLTSELLFILTAGLSSLAKGCTRLTRLDLEEVNLLTDNTLIALASACPQLQILMLSHCKYLTVVMNGTLIDPNALKVN